MGASARSSASSGALTPAMAVRRVSQTSHLAGQGFGQGHFDPLGGGRSFTRHIPRPLTWPLCSINCLPSDVACTVLAIGENVGGG